MLDTNVVLMLCNIENPTVDFVSFATSDKHLSSTIHNVEARLVRRSNVGWVVSMKMLILSNILPATLLTN